jgi:hypothetical protein
MIHSNVAVWLLQFMLTSANSDATSISFEQLLREMVDLKTLAVYPDPPYIAARSSSCDTSVSADSVPLGFGNNDRGYFRAVLPEGYLMLDAEGPGVITHIWSANPIDSLVFYFDNKATPSWTVSMACLLDGTDLIKEPFSHTSAQGENCYFPIPFNKHCRVFYKGNRPNYLYYHIDYRTYTHSTLLPTFDTAMVTIYRSLIDSIKNVLTDSLDTPARDAFDLVFAGNIHPGQTVNVFKLDGPAAIEQIVVTTSSDINPAFLRSCLLEITFDNPVYPQVRLPVGEFFCSIPGQKPYWTLPLSITSSGKMVSRWFMPFREHAMVRFVNMGDDSASLTMQMRTQPVQFSDKTMYFFARWRQDNSVVTSKNLYSLFYMPEPLQDYPVLHIKGKGVHVGTILHIWNREDEWWGEGDDKITVDDLPEPGIKGTGTEDYFGYAWSSVNTFSHAFHTQPYTDGFSGHTINARFHISDPQPFTKSYNFDMEVQTVNKPTMLDYGRAVLYYACGEASTDHDTITGEDVFLRTGRTFTNRIDNKAHDEPDGIIVHYDPQRRKIIAGCPNDNIEINISTLNGKMVQKKHLNGSATIYIASLPSGVYFANVLVKGLKKNIRFIVSR